MSTSDDKGKSFLALRFLRNDASSFKIRNANARQVRFPLKKNVKYGLSMTELAKGIPSHREPSPFVFQERFFGFSVKPPFEDSRGLLFQDFTLTLPCLEDSLRKANNDEEEEYETFRHQAVEGYVRHLLKDKMREMEPSLYTLKRFVEKLRSGVREDADNAKSGVQASLRHIEDHLRGYMDAVNMLSYHPHFARHQEKQARQKEIKLRYDLKQMQILVGDTIDRLLEKEKWRSSVWKAQKGEKNTSAEKVSNLVEYIAETLKKIDEQAKHILEEHGSWGRSFGQRGHVDPRAHSHFSLADAHHGDMFDRAIERLVENEAQKGSSEQPNVL